MIVEDRWVLFEVVSCSLNVGSIRAVITVHYQAKGKLRIVRIRCVVSGNKEIMVTYRMFRSRGIGVAKLVSDVSTLHMAETFSS